MWVFLNQAMLSIVAAPDRPGMLLVRARVAGDIEVVFPGAVVRRTPDRDYLFRALVPRQAVEHALAREVRAIDYGNFKASVPDDRRHAVYSRVWGAALALQEQRPEIAPVQSMFDDQPPPASRRRASPAARVRSAMSRK